YLADHLARLVPPLKVRLKRDTTFTSPSVRGVRLQPDRDRVQEQRLQPDRDLSDRETQIVEYLRRHGASFFGPLHEAVGGGYPAETVDAIWNLVWSGLLTNDTFHALRAFTHARTARRRQKRTKPMMFRSRRLAPSSAEGRWALVPRTRG